MAEYPYPLTKAAFEKIKDESYLPKEQKEELARSQDFIEYALTFNKSRLDLDKIAYSTYNNDRYNIEKFRDFVSRTTGEIILPMNELSIVIFDDYKKYCLKEGNQKQSINKKLKPLFVALEYAGKCQLITPKLATDICDGYYNLQERSYNGEFEEEEVHYLSQEQLKEFLNMRPFMQHDRTRDYMDLFLFSYYSCGLRYSDLLTLEWSHIDWAGRAVKKTLFKGKKPHIAPLMDGAFEILRRWKVKKLNTKFVFDLLPADFDLKNRAALDNERKNKNRAIQTSLQSIGRKMKANLTFNLSIHVARHSFAVYALNTGVDVHKISQLLGHSSIMTTEKVYAKFLPSTLKDDVMILLNKPIGETA